MYPIEILYNHINKYAIAFLKTLKRYFLFYVESFIPVRPVLKVFRRFFIYEKTKAYSK